MSAIALTGAARVTKRTESQIEEQHFLLHNVDWSTYVAVSDAFVDRPGLRITYDRGSMEFMTISQKHERIKKLLGRLVETLTLERQLDIIGVGSMTCRKEDLDRGLEPDECFYIANVATMRGVEQYDAAIHPPPDLAIEVDISRSSLDRLGIYAAFRVPEVSRLEGETIKVYRLGRSGKYKAVASSLTFPKFPVQELVRFVRMALAEGDNTMIRAFEKWLHERQKA